MDFDLSQRQRELLEAVRSFIAREVVPAVPVYAEQLAANRWDQPAILQDLKGKARAAGLWNLFMPPSPDHDTDEFRGAGLTNLE